MPPSYVIGNSPAISDLSEAQRQYLDQAPWVFVCNGFLSRWEEAGFRPTVWAWGDTYLEEMRESLELELAVIANDTLLQERLKHCFVGIDRNSPRRTVENLFWKWMVTAKLYRRGECWDRDQSLARSLGHNIFHIGSTLTDLVNLAWILNPSQEIRLFGNAFGNPAGHFWGGDARQVGVESPANHWGYVVTAMWTAMGDLYRAGIPLVDCNAEHAAPLPEGIELPRGPLIPDLDTETSG